MGLRTKLGRDYLWSIAFYMLLKGVICALDDDYRRCRNPAVGDGSSGNASSYALVVSSALQGFFDSACDVCPERDAVTQTMRLLSNKTRAVVLLTHAATIEKMLDISAGLLASGSRVTIITGPYTPEHPRIRRALFLRIPCEKHFFASVLLTFKSYSVDASQMCPRTVDAKSTPGDIILCSIQNAMPIVKALIVQLTFVSQPGVLVLDATMIAGLLVTERQLLPAIVIAENEGTFLRYILGAESRPSGSLWNPQTWFKILLSDTRDNLNSLDLTSSFIALNKIRSTLQLARVRHIADLWRAGGNIVLSSDPDARGWQNALPNLRFLSDPLLPHCIACLAAPVIADPSVPIVLVSIAFHNDEAGRSSSRRLLQAFELARASIKQLSRDEFCARFERDCWYGPADFQVVVPGTMPEVLPPGFVTAEETDFLDSLVRHKPVAVASTCNISNLWTRSLGPPVLCVDLSSPPHETALRLLEMLRRQSQETTLPNQSTAGLGDGLERVVSVVEQIGLLRDRRGNTWKDGWEMGLHIQAHLQASPFMIVHSGEVGLDTFIYSSLLVTLAWLVLFCTAAYLSFKDTATMRKFRSRRLHHRNHTYVTFSAVTDEILFRLPHFDRVWNLWTEWLSGKLRQWDELATPQVAEGSTEEEDHPSHTRRKRHISKKRH